MKFGLATRLGRWLSKLLTRERTFDPASSMPMCDFERLRYEIRPGDVLLVEGRSRVSDVIKLITQSPWTHAALYIGRLYDIEDSTLRDAVQSHYNGDPEEQLVIEALLGEGTVVHNLEKYRHEQLRICRARGISPLDAQKLINFAIGKLGSDYDIRQLLDLARFMLPYAIVPRRFRSSLFTRKPGSQTRTVCSTMLAEAFHSIDFPMLPFAEKTPDGRVRLFRRNPRLYTPKDFDYSPYFDIIKYPFFGLDDVRMYRHLPWHNKELYCNDINDCYVVETETTEAEEQNSQINAKPEIEEITSDTNKVVEPASQNVNLLDDVEQDKRNSA